VQAAAEFYEHNMTGRRGELRQVFHAFDFEHAGWLSSEVLMQIGTKRRELGQKGSAWTEEKNAKMFARMDATGDGTINKNEFMNHFEKMHADDSAAEFAASTQAYFECAAAFKLVKEEEKKKALLEAAASPPLDPGDPEGGPGGEGWHKALLEHHAAAPTYISTHSGWTHDDHVASVSGPHMAGKAGLARLKGRLGAGTRAGMGRGPPGAGGRYSEGAIASATVLSTGGSVAAAAQALPLALALALTLHPPCLPGPGRRRRCSQRAGWAPCCPCPPPSQDASPDASPPQSCSPSCSPGGGLLWRPPPPAPGGGGGSHPVPVLPSPGRGMEASVEEGGQKGEDEDELLALIKATASTSRERETGGGRGRGKQMGMMELQP
jgi:hypothetical protein